MSQVVIGLEVHAQLATTSKLFCGCEVVDSGLPNRSLCPVCMGHPGAMPQLNEQAVQLALRAGLSLGMRVHARSRFDRKHYFYPDLPKGFQITQQAWPLCSGGQLHLRQGSELSPYEIQRLHIEEDSGRLHHSGDKVQVDWNRAGVPLIEVVGAPDIESPSTAEAWLRMLHRVLVAAGVSHGAMEKGQLRCDANVSLRRPDGGLGVRVEIKNLNSFRLVRRALAFEVERLQAALAAGEQLHPETRAWAGDRTMTLRDKPSELEYRFQPEPDLPELVVDNQQLGMAARALPGLPPLDIHLLRTDDGLTSRWMREYGLKADQVATLTADSELAALFIQCVESGGAPADMARWLQRDVLAHLRGRGVGLSETPLLPSHIVDLQEMVAAGEITRATAEGILDWVQLRGGEVRGLVAVQGLARVREEAQIHAAVQAVLEQHPERLAAYRAGREGLLGFFIGEVRTASDGRIDPGDLKSALLSCLEAGA